AVAEQQKAQQRDEDRREIADDAGIRDRGEAEAPGIGDEVRGIKSGREQHLDAFPPPREREAEPRRAIAAALERGPGEEDRNREGAAVERRRGWSELGDPKEDRRARDRDDRERNLEDGKARRRAPARSRARTLLGGDRRKIGFRHFPASAAAPPCAAKLTIPPQQAPKNTAFTIEACCFLRKRFAS